MNRRKFLAKSSLVSAGALMSGKTGLSFPFAINSAGPGPVVLSTWDFGLKANEVAWATLTGNGSALDAVEQGIRVVEGDAGNHSVGLGGYPDRDGHVTLDACIMSESGRAGSVTFLEHIVHPISVARLVMEKTPHVMLSGDGALMFALDNGFQKENLLTEESRNAWEEWMKKQDYRPVINVENHDTIGLICADAAGNLSGGCSTSGLAFKMHGRVGDSPIIGAALYVDNEAGAAVTTGLGELVMRSLSSFLAVELMRSGKSPQQACEEAIGRIVAKNSEYKDFQVGILALGKDGMTGAYSIQPGFSYALTSTDRHEVLVSASYLK